MIYVALSVICSVLVSIVLKLARRFGVELTQAIAWNYAVASGLTALLLQPALPHWRAAGTPWLALLGLGLLLPTVFLALAASVRHAGIVRSDAAQRLSLLLSLLAAFALFGERLDAGKGAGIALGVLALACLLWRDGRGAAGSDRSVAAWRYPLAVFGGFAAIDILFKYVALAGLALAASLQVMFALALLVALLPPLWQRLHGGVRFGGRSALAGALLGLANFGNILFYLRAHRALPQHPALVFAGMNLGVVALGALVGTLGFGERLSRCNLAGVALALLAIVLISRG